MIFGALTSRPPTALARTRRSNFSTACSTSIATPPRWSVPFPHSIPCGFDGWQNSGLQRPSDLALPEQLWAREVGVHFPYPDLRDLIGIFFLDSCVDLRIILTVVTEKREFDGRKSLQNGFQPCAFVAFLAAKSFAMFRRNFFEL